LISIAQRIEDVSQQVRLLAAEEKEVAKRVRPELEALEQARAFSA
jgi:hypothetical protein